MRTVFTLGLLALATGVAAQDKIGKVEVGKPAPDFKLAVAGWKDKEFSLKSVQGKNVVLFFYPKAMTRGCTIESCGFRDKLKDFEAANTILVGISVDTVDLQQKFIDKEKLNFPLLADPEKKVTKDFGALGSSGLASRYTYVIDKKGIVRKIYTRVNPSNHPEEVLKFVKENLTEK